VLLATLPEPNLPPEIRRRVLVALARSKTADRALDHLLERGADIRVPVGIAQDVLARLEPLRRQEQQDSVTADAGSEARLDALLDRAGTVDVPADLARRMLQRLERERAIPASARSGSSHARPLAAGREGRLAAASPIEEGRLDALLARAGHVAVPEDLTAHTLSRLSPARRALARPRLEIVRSTWVYAAAAVLVAALLVWALRPKPTGSILPDMATKDSRSHADPGVNPNDSARDVDVQDKVAREGAARHDRASRPEPHHADADVARAPDPKMLEAWDVLENWDLLTKNDVDVILSTVQPADELLLEFQDEG
jgi:hypothetical protein